MEKKIKFEIFTDAGSFNNGKKRYPDQMQISSSVGVLSFNQTIITGFKSLNLNTTNNYGEMYAIYLALKNSIEIIDRLKLEKPYNIDLYSDSMISVNGLTKWLDGWKKNAKNGILYNSEGKMVCNQHLILMIDKYFLSNTDYSINIYHIRGHRDINKKSSLDKARKTFSKINGFNVSDKKLKFIIYMNNICDRYAQEVLCKGVKKYVK